MPKTMLGTARVTKFMIEVQFPVCPWLEHTGTGSSDVRMKENVKP